MMQPNFDKMRQIAKICLMKASRALLALLTAVIIAGSAMAQDDDPIRVDTSVVRLNIGVADGRGRPIIDLPQSDFKIFEDGKEQKITRFQAAPAPFSLVLILDMSGSTLPYRQVMKTAAFRFIDALAPDDRVAVIEFYDKVNLRNNFTTDRGVIAHSIDASNGRGKTQFFKALDLAMNKLSDETGRRKAVVILSDGVDTAAKDQDRDVIKELPVEKVAAAIDPDKNEDLHRILRKSDAIGATIYPLALPSGDPARLPDPSPQQIAMFKAARTRLEMIAARTGGTLRTINRLEDMGRMYSEVAADLRTLYTIEYSPSDDKRDGKWRSIKVVVADDRLIARTRTGYFAR